MWLVSLFKGITGSNGQFGSIVVKGQRRHRRFEPWQRCEFLLVVAIPDYYSPITATSTECPEPRMELDSVDRVDRIIHTMTLEGILLLTTRCREAIHRLDRHTSLNRS